MYTPLVIVEARKGGATRELTRQRPRDPSELVDAFAAGLTAATLAFSDENNPDAVAYNPDEIVIRILRPTREG